ncbi:Uncharacterised protein [Arcanobacterium haemolyticum]|nr:Uncharacterised protein [Arcanobacterium haemolyticum]
MIYVLISLLLVTCGFNDIDAAKSGYIGTFSRVFGT